MEKNEAQEEHMIKEENICHMNCIEKTRRRMKNENEVNILSQIYFVGEKNREGKRGTYLEKYIYLLWGRKRTEKEKEESISRRKIYHLWRRKRTEKEKEENMFLWRRRRTEKQKEDNFRSRTIVFFL